jgi:hypothetical protein
VVYLKGRKPFAFPGLWDRWLDRDTGAPFEPSLQQQAASLQPGSMAPKLSSLRTSFLRFFITDTEAEKVLFTEDGEPDSPNGKRLISAQD